VEQSAPAYAPGAAHGWLWVERCRGRARAPGPVGDRVEEPAACAAAAGSAPGDGARLAV